MNNGEIRKELISVRPAPGIQRASILKPVSKMLKKTFQVYIKTMQGKGGWVCAGRQ